MRFIASKMAVLEVRVLLARLNDGKSPVVVILISKHYLRCRADWERLPSGLARCYQVPRWRRHHCTSLITLAMAQDCCLQIARSAYALLEARRAFLLVPESLCGARRSVCCGVCWNTAFECDRYGWSVFKRAEERLLRNGGLSVVVHTRKVGSELVMVRGDVRGTALAKLWRWKLHRSKGLLRIGRQRTICMKQLKGQGMAVASSSHLSRKGNGTVYSAKSSQYRAKSPHQIPSPPSESHLHLHPPVLPAER